MMHHLFTFHHLLFTVFSPFAVNGGRIMVNAWRTVNGKPKMILGVIL